LGQPRPSQKAEQLQARGAVEETQTKTPLLYGTDQNADLTSGSATDLYAGMPETTLVVSQHTSPRPRGLLTRRRSTGRDLLIEEEADAYVMPDPVIEKMLKQFGSYVKAFEKEHGIQVMENVSWPAAASFVSLRRLLQYLFKPRFQIPSPGGCTIQTALAAL
jgi:hypothetical protein